MKCIYCEDWKPNMEIICAPLMLQVARRPDDFTKDINGVIMAYSGKKLKYCPWCGNELEED